MSIEESYGAKRLNEDAGYTHISIDDIKKPITPDIDSGDKDAMQAAADALAKSRQEAGPLKLSYTDPDPERPDAIDGPETAAEIAKHVRADYHAREIAPAEEEAEQAIRDHIDRDIRNQPTDADRAQHAQAQRDAAAYAQAEQQRQYEQIAAAHAAARAAQQSRQHDANLATIQARGNGAIASLQAIAPEMVNLRVDQVAGAVEAMRHRGEHTKADAVVRHLRSINDIYTQQQQAMQARANHEQNSHRAHVQQQYQAFERSIANEPAARKEAISIEMENILKGRGMSQSDYAAAVARGGDLGRFLASEQFLGSLWDAAAARVDSNSHKSTISDLKNNLVRQVPPVSAPGARGSSNGFAQAPLAGAALTNRIANLANKGGDRGLKAAAAALAASRRGGR
jgi:hypothetical protein